MEVDNSDLDLLGNQVEQDTLAELRSNPADLKPPHRVHSAFITHTFFFSYAPHLPCMNNNREKLLINYSYTDTHIRKTVL